jgi:hypothetical protein
MARVLTSLNREKGEGMTLLLLKVSVDNSCLNYLIIGIDPTGNSLLDGRGGKPKGP